MLKPVSVVFNGNQASLISCLKPFTVKDLQFFLNKILKLDFVLLKSKYGRSNYTWYDKSYLYTSPSTAK